LPPSLTNTRVDGDLDARRIRIVRGDVRAQEFVADVRAVALEGFAAGQLVVASCMARTTAGGSRWVTSPDPEIDQRTSGIRR